MKGKTTIQSKHADCFTSPTSGSTASFSPVFPFNEIIVTVNSISWTIISTSSVTVDACERRIFIQSAIKPANDSIFSATEAIVRATSPIISIPQRTIPLTHPIIDRASAIVFGAQTIVSGMQTIVSVPEAVISGGPQIPANERVPDGSTKIIISELETTICGAEAIIPVFPIFIYEATAVISKQISIIDGPATVIFGSHSIIDIREAMMSVVEAVISATDADFSKADTTISAFPTSFFAAATVIFAAEKTAGAMPAVVSLNHQPTRR